MTQAPIAQPWRVMPAYDDNIDVMNRVTDMLQSNSESLREMVKETVGRQMGYKRPSDWVRLVEGHLPVFVVEMTVDDWLWAWNHKNVRESWLEFYRGELVGWWETQVPQAPQPPEVQPSMGEQEPPPTGRSNGAAATPTPEEAAELQAQALMQQYQQQLQVWQEEHQRFQGGPLTMLDPLMPYYRGIANLDPLRVVELLRTYEAGEKARERNGDT